MTYAKRLSPKEPMYNVVWSRAHGRCEALKGFKDGGERGTERCAKQAEDIFVDEPHMLALCHECRVRGVGLTLSERNSRTKQSKEKQVPLLGAGQMSKQEDGNK